MAYDGLITSFLGQGVVADRPATPNITPEALAFWWSTDTNEMSVWVESAWIEDVFGGSGISDGDYGDITVSSLGTAWAIDNDAVTYAKLQNASATSRILGRKTASAGDFEECTLSDILDFIGSATQGDILYRGATTWARLGAGTSGQVLTTGGAGANPSWADATGGGGYEVGSPTPPTTTDLSTWLNQGTSTATDGTGALILKVQSSTQYRSLVKASPSTPYDLYCRVETGALATDALTTEDLSSAGLVFRNSANNRAVVFVSGWDRTITGDDINVYPLSVGRWTGDGATFNATPIAAYAGRPWKWLRAHNDGTTLTFYASMTGKNWHQVGTETISTFLSAVTHHGVTGIGVGTNCNPIAEFSYFSTTAPS